MTITLHQKDDINSFIRFFDIAWDWPRSMRLNVFEGVDQIAPITGWEVRNNVTWRKNCPLPEGEDFMRYASVTNQSAEVPA